MIMYWSSSTTFFSVSAEIQSCKNHTQHHKMCTLYNGSLVYLYLSFHIPGKKESGCKYEGQVVGVHLAGCAGSYQREQLEQALGHNAVGGWEQEHQQLQALCGRSW